MNREQRAKQFIPFDALKGLKEALLEKEEIRTRVEKKELTEEMKWKISRVLSSVSVGDVVRVNFYQAGHYIDIEAKVMGIDEIRRFIKLGDGIIYFSDIYRIKVIERKGI